MRALRGNRLLVRDGIPPRAGTLIPARKVVSFRPSLVLKAEVSPVQAEREEAVTRTGEEGELPKGK